MKHILATENTKLLKALKLISLSGEKNLIIIGKKKKFLGTISDGDIRRHLLKSDNLNNSIKNIYNKKATFLIEGKFNKKIIKSIFLQKDLDLIPILNKQKKVIDFISWRKFFKNQENKINLGKVKSLVIMAGGEGTRMRPFTDLFPKPLIPIKGTPIIDSIIKKFAYSNIKNFIISVRAKSKILKTYLVEKKYKNLKFLEEKKPLGTVGSLSLLKGKIKEDFFLSNCDILADINIENFYNYHKQNKNLISMVVSNKNFSIPYGVCTLNKNGIFTGIEEKPKYSFFVNIGLYLINPKVLRFIPNNKFFHMTDLIRVIKKKRFTVGMYPIQDEDWIDVGQWSEYKKVLKKL